MSNFYKALTSVGKHTTIPEEYDYFGKLIGGWTIDYINNSTSRVIKGEWHFSWILEGMAIQDVIILPEFEYGTTLRVYNPITFAWDVAYAYTGRIMRLEARKQNGKIVLTSLENERKKWVFVEIKDNYFHWQDVSVQEDGEWRVDFDIYAHRV